MREEGTTADETRCARLGTNYLNRVTAKKGEGKTPRPRLWNVLRMAVFDIALRQVPSREKVRK